MNFLCAYVRDRKYDLRFALEAKPNEPRGDLYFATTASYLAFIGTLDHPDMVGVNPEVAHEHMVGLNVYHVVAQAIDAGKLFHIDLNDQKFSRFDQDLRFGSESIKPLFFLVKLLEESGYDGPRHFDAHAYRISDAEDVWAFARGCMRTYLILQDKARRFREDAEIQALLAQIRGGGEEPRHPTSDTRPHARPPSSTDSSTARGSKGGRCRTSASINSSWSYSSASMRSRTGRTPPRRQRNDDGDRRNALWPRGRAAPGPSPPARRSPR